MVDRLRLFWNRPLRDADRTRLFAIAIVLIAAATAALAQFERPTPSPRAQPPDDQPAVVSPSPGSERVLPPAASVPPAQPSEEGTHTLVAAARADVAASKRAARQFLAGYLPYTYGHGRATRIRPATAALCRRLVAQRPRVPARERRRRPRLVLLQSASVGHRHAELTALIHDGRRRYTIALELQRTAEGWQVARVGS